MDSEQIHRGIASFSRWHYRFDLNGHTTPVADLATINRHEQRRLYFFDPLVRHFGGTLRGKRVLDLGCNAGFWSLHAAEAGCDFVLGIDGREMHVEQANFVFQVKNVERSRYEFVKGNVLEFDFSDIGDFDIVLCLGLLYHVSNPLSLVERMSRVNTHVLLIDTALSPAPGSCFEVRHEGSLADPRSAVDYELVLYPTAAAVFDVTAEFGYTTKILKPAFFDYTGCEDYRAGHRRAFVCSKRSYLSDAFDFERTTSVRSRARRAANAMRWLLR